MTINHLLYFVFITSFINNLLAYERLSNSSLASTNYYETDNSSNFISYLEELLTEQILTDEDLIKFKDSLENNTLSNPLHFNHSSSYYIHYKGLENLIEEGGLNHNLILDWIIKTLEKRGHEFIERSKVKAETAYPAFNKMEFNPIKPGYYKKDKDSFYITEPFEMMSTEVTQWQWSMIMGGNPSFFNKGEDSRTIILPTNDNPITLRPNNPVERISWDNIQDFIAKLNDLASKDNPLIYAIIPDHKKNYYYNLPTRHQWVYVATNQGQIKKYEEYFTDGKTAYEYGWLQGKNYETHPVGTLNPFMINGYAFYDLMGNIEELVTEDPILTKYIAASMGGNFMSHLHLDLYMMIASTYFLHYKVNKDKIASDKIGFRLIRYQVSSEEK
jgi:formylglycine-generating enzyme required for sulfatase activity